MIRTGFIGWRGMVGSVLRERMVAEGDYDGLDARFFSTSNPGGEGPDVGQGSAPLLDAHDLDALAACEILVTCQGGGYTNEIHPQLRARGWEGLWIDAASALRMDPESVLVLDPVNGEALRAAVHRGTKVFCGSNCTVSLMLMAMVGLIRTGEVDWITAMTYQAASGAGARHMAELVDQMRRIGHAAGPLLQQERVSALELDRVVSGVSKELPAEHFGVPLAGSALPWIDRLMESGQTREEWKAQVEASKLLGVPLPVDGVCVRIGALRCHAQALTVKLKRDVPLADIEAALAQAHDWVEVVPNEKQASLARLTPTAVGGTLQVPVGRLHKMTLGEDFLAAYTVGDQLLWGAAEPLRRMLGIVREVWGR